MGSFLVVVPPLTGHVNPTVAVGGQLARRGHRVTWAAYGPLGRSLLPASAPVVTVGGDLPETLVDSIRDRSERLRGAAALEFLWKDFLLPLATAMAPGVEAAAREVGADALVVDQQTFAGAIAARRLGLPWATSATTAAELVDPFQGLPKVGRWVREGLDALQEAHGLPPGEAGDLRFSPHLVLAYTTADLTGPVSLPPGAGPLALVGPAIAAPADGDPRTALGEFPVAWLEEGTPRVLVSLGTVSGAAGRRFFTEAAAALGEMALRAVLVAPNGMVEEVPPNVLQRPFVPQLALLEHMDAVVSHGGQNTVSETLARGVPMVLAPIRDDQPIIAEQVVQAGAGLRVRFGRVRAPELRGAVETVLAQPSYRSAAQAVARSFAAAGGAAAAADRLEELLS